jgi:hypothetical protein
VPAQAHHEFLRQFSDPTQIRYQSVIRKIREAAPVLAMRVKMKLPRLMIRDRVERMVVLLQVPCTGV